MKNEETLRLSNSSMNKSSQTLISSLMILFSGTRCGHHWNLHALYYLPCMHVVRRYTSKVLQVTELGRSWRIRLFISPFLTSLSSLWESMRNEETDSSLWQTVLLTVIILILDTCVKWRRDDSFRLQRHSMEDNEIFPISLIIDYRILLPYPRKNDVCTPRAITSRCLDYAKHLISISLSCDSYGYLTSRVTLQWMFSMINIYFCAWLHLLQFDMMARWKVNTFRNSFTEFFFSEKN